MAKTYIFYSGVQFSSSIKTVFKLPYRQDSGGVVVTSLTARPYRPGSNPGRSISFFFNFTT